MTLKLAGLARPPANRMIPCMNQRQGARAAEPGRWISLSERFLDAAECLPGSPAFDAPRGELLARAVEHRLKAYLTAARGGAPYGDDLNHLARLARHCGLKLDAAQEAAVVLLDGLRSSGTDGGPVPSTAQIRDLCAAMAGQMAEAG